MTDTALIKQFKADPVQGYSALLDTYTPVILRMIRRFLSDPDEVMETYTLEDLLKPSEALRRRLKPGAGG